MVGTSRILFRFCNSPAEILEETATVYSPVPREQIAETLVHLRSLFREMRPSNQKDYRAHERRELLTKNLLSNLFRTKDHPTLHAVLEVGDAFSLTLDGAHRLFGYELERIREYDLKLNSGFTHITEKWSLELDCSPAKPLAVGRNRRFHSEDWRGSGEVRLRDVGLSKEQRDWGVHLCVSNYESRSCSVTASGPNRRPAARRSSASATPPYGLRFPPSADPP